MLYVGIDPGEEWCGVAILNIEPKWIQTESMVLSVSDHGYLACAERVSNLPRWSDDTPTFIIEDFQVRPVGHNAFTKGLTLRFIGALEYAIHMKGTTEFIPPGKPADAEALVGKVIDPYIRDYHGDKRWKHAQSAWRCIGMFMLKNRRVQLEEIRALKTIADMERPERYMDKEIDDLLTPIYWWHRRPHVRSKA